MTSCGEGGQQYVATQGIGPHEKIVASHFSSSPGWAKNTDIVPSIRKRFNEEPIWQADTINFRIKTIYEQLTEEHNRQLREKIIGVYPFEEWLLIHYSK